MVGRQHHCVHIEFCQVMRQMVLHALEAQAAFTSTDLINWIVLTTGLVINFGL